jgi:hypothetical protein
MAKVCPDFPMMVIGKGSRRHDSMAAQRSMGKEAHFWGIPSTNMIYGLWVVKFKV